VIPSYEAHWDHTLTKDPWGTTVGWGAYEDELFFSPDFVGTPGQWRLRLYHSFADTTILRRLYMRLAMTAGRSTPVYWTAALNRYGQTASEGAAEYTGAELVGNGIIGTAVEGYYEIDIEFLRKFSYLNNAYNALTFEFLGESGVEGDPPFYIDLTKMIFDGYPAHPDIWRATTRLFNDYPARDFT